MPASRCRLDGGCGKSTNVHRALHGVLQDVQGPGSISRHSGTALSVIHSDRHQLDISLVTYWWDRSVKCSESCSEHVSFGFLHPTWKMSTWSPTFQQSVFKRYHSDKHFSEFLPTRWRQKSTGIDVERNYVTVSVCIFEHWKWPAQGTGTVPFIPTTRRTTLGDRAFPVTAARAWNALPSSVRSAPSFLQFRRDLKTALFQSSYPSP